MIDGTTSALGQERRIGAVRNISALPPRADVGADVVEPTSCLAFGAAWKAHGKHRALAQFARHRHVAAHLCLRAVTG
jgi:hypothetical protein